MEKKGVKNSAPESYTFIQLVQRARNGDKRSMEEILNFFEADIEYLSRFIKLPREEAVQALTIELIDIICEKL